VPDVVRVYVTGPDIIAAVFAGVIKPPRGIALSFLKKVRKEFDESMQNK
jgi:hypothetical protein